MADYERAIELEPNLPSAFSNRGLAWASKGEFRLAIADYTKAIQLDPNLPVAFNNRGNAHAARGQLEAAVADYGEAIRPHPKYVNPSHNFPHSFLNKDEYYPDAADFTAA